MTTEKDLNSLVENLIVSNESVSEFHSDDLKRLAKESENASKTNLESDSEVVLRLQNITQISDEELYSHTRDVFANADITLLKVDLKNQSFECEIDMHVFWRQPEIEKHVPSGSIWSIFDDGQSLPIDINDMFEHDSGPIWIDKRFFYHEKTQVIELHLQFTDTFSERMELYRFPADRQFLNILLQSRVESGNWNWLCQAPQWVPQHRRDIVRSRLGQSIAEYEMFAPWADFRVINDDDDEQPPFKFRLRVQRYTSYFVGSVIMPMFLIVACCFVSLVIPEGITNLADRFSVTITLMLAAVAARYTVSEALPPVNYLTLMDYYLIITFLAITGFVVENAASGLVEEHYGYIGGLTIDYWFGGILGSLWIIINAFMLLACFTDIIRQSWEVMDELDRAPSEEDEYKPATPDLIQGSIPVYNSQLPHSNTLVD